MKGEKKWQARQGHPYKHVDSLPWINYSSDTLLNFINTLQAICGDPGTGNRTSRKGRNKTQNGRDWSDRVVTESKKVTLSWQLLVFFFLFADIFKNLPIIFLLQVGSVCICIDTGAGYYEITSKKKKNCSCHSQWSRHFCGQVTLLVVIHQVAHIHYINNELYESTPGITIRNIQNESPLSFLCVSWEKHYILSSTPPPIAA